jgi:hypothetical protein
MPAAFKLELCWVICQKSRTNFGIQRQFIEFICVLHDTPIIMRQKSFVILRLSSSLCTLLLLMYSFFHY